VNAQPKSVPEPAQDAPFDFEAFFHAHYPRIARVIARLTGDPARAEELAVEAMWKLWQSPRVHGDAAGGWLYRTALRLGLNELRSAVRRARHESLAEFTAASPSPEDTHAAAQEQQQVRDVLAALDPRQAGLLLLRSSGLSYEEVAAALEINPASVGTFLSRAQQAFRKEYIKRYGPQR
jgi:RNA polymerase sigma-70 factor, ECF subfamily